MLAELIHCIFKFVLNEFLTAHQQTDIMMDHLVLVGHHMSDATLTPMHFVVIH